MHDAIASGDEDVFKQSIETLEQNWKVALFLSPNKPVDEDGVPLLVRAALYSRSYMISLMLPYAVVSPNIMEDTEDFVHCERFDPNILDPKTGMTPLYAAVMQNEIAETAKTRSTILLLLSGGARMDMACANGETPQAFVLRTLQERWSEGRRREKDVWLLNLFEVLAKMPDFSPERLAAVARQEIRQATGEKFKMKV